MTASFAIAASPEFRECAAESVSEAVKDSTDESSDDVTFGKVSVNELSVGRFGDQTIAYRVTIPVESQGFNLEVKIESALVRVGRARSIITTSSVGSGVTTEELSGYVQTAVQRLRGALAEN